jgi:hypothetical protein
LLGSATADRGFDRVEFCDPAERLGSDRRAGRVVHLVEFAPGVRSTGGKYDVAACGPPLEPGVAVDLEDAAEPLKV